MSTPSTYTTAAAATTMWVVVADSTIRVHGARGAGTGLGIAVEGEGGQTHLRDDKNIQLWEKNVVSMDERMWTENNE